MGIDIDVTAIIIMEFCGVVSFLVALLLHRQSRRISDKRRMFADALANSGIKDRADGKCYSSEWIMDNIVQKPRKMLNATPFLAVVVAITTVLLYFEVGPRAFSALLSLGYVTFVALIGFAILMETDAFEAYSYSKAVHQVPIEELDKADQSYIDIAHDALRMATIRFLIIGVFFVAVGPLIPEIFYGLFYTFVSYISIVFHATGALSQVSQGLAVLFAFLVPAILLFLPLLLGRAIFYEVKTLTQKMLRRSRDR